MHSALYVGRLRHRRHAPRPHAFAYPLYLCFLDLAELEQVFRGRWFWSTRRPTLAWLRRADYLGPADLPLDEAVRRRVAQDTGHRPEGPIRLLTHLRNYGHCFNPVSFYYCYDAADTRVTCVVAEITNTPWGERHAYVLPVPAETPPGGELQFALDKIFHVSPFMPLGQAWRWRFSTPGQRLAVHMDSFEAGRHVFDATLVLKRHEITGRSLAGVLLRYPASTLRVLASIYWQALRLKWKRVPFHPHPGAPPVTGT